MKNMINKYGNPDAVVFSNTLDSYNLIWGFDDIFKILKELNNQGQTILLVEENVSRVINVSDHIYLIDDGLIAWQGTGEELSSESNIMEVYLGV